MSFVGIGVVGDLSKIGRDYYCLSVIENIQHIMNLGQFSRRRDVIKNNVIPLENIVNMVLNEKINKDNSARCSR